MEGECGDAAIGFQEFDRQYFAGFGNCGLHWAFHFGVSLKNDQKLDKQMQIDRHPRFRQLRTRKNFVE
jgi:hypothetical protein